MRRCAVITRLVKAGAGAYLAPIDSRTRRHAVESPITTWHHNPWSCPVFTGSSSLPDTKCQGPSLTGGQEVAGSNPASPTERTLHRKGSLSWGSDENVAWGRVLGRVPGPTRYSR